MNDNLHKLTEYFSKFPGIGSRQAKRFVYFLLSRDKRFIEDFTQAILDAKKDTSQCSLCFRFYSSPRTEETVCNACSSPNTSKDILMVVEKDVDLENIQKTEVFDGSFFVLGGSVPILDKKPVEKIRAKELFTRVQNGAKKELKEVILALSINPEGENTILYLEKILEPLAEKYSLKISTLGRGLSTGTELEYSDSDTLENALKNRN
jgi:recombination protein RecR